MTAILGLHLSDICEQQLTSPGVHRTRLYSALHWNGLMLKRLVWYQFHVASTRVMSMHQSGARAHEAVMCHLLLQRMALISWRLSAWLALQQQRQVCWAIREVLQMTMPTQTNRESMSLSLICRRRWRDQMCQHKLDYCWVYVCLCVCPSARNTSSTIATAVLVRYSSKLKFRSHIWQRRLSSINNNTGSSERTCASIYFRFCLFLGLCPRQRYNFSSDFSNLVCRFILPRTRTNSFGGATGSDLCECA